MKLVDASAYYERPVAIVSSSSSAGTQQHVAYPSFPNGGFRVMFQVRSSYEDALTAAHEIQGRFTNQGVAVLEGSMLGLGKFLVTPVGMPTPSRPNNIPQSARHPAFKDPLAVRATDVVDRVVDGLRALVRTDGSVLEFPAVR